MCSAIWKRIWSGRLSSDGGISEEVSSRKRVSRDGGSVREVSRGRGMMLMPEEVGSRWRIE